MREAGLENGPDTAATASPETEEDLSSFAAKSGSTSTGNGTGTSCRNDGSSRSCKDLAVVCLGARAESTMPPAFWRETLFALPCVSHLSLHLIGPELSLPSGMTTSEDGDRNGERRDTPSARHTAVVTVGVRTAEVEWTRAVLVPAVDACFEGEEEPEATVGSASGPELGAGERATSAVRATTEARQEGELKTAERAVDNADAFVLFNPGLGHPHLREGWAGALERLLATGKPIIVSSHSRKDLERDARVLREAGAARCFPCREATALEGGDGDFSRKNTFRSLMASEDPLSAPGGEELVACNWGIMVVRGAQNADGTGSS